MLPKAFPIEFRRDVVAVARKGEAPLSQVAKDFGLSESCLRRGLWGLRRPAEAAGPAVASVEAAAAAKMISVRRM